MWRAVVVSIVWWLLPSVALAGTVLYVDDNAPAGGDGLTWETAYRFFQDALTAAREPQSDVNEIRVAQGVYRPDQDEQNPQGTLDQTATFALVDTVAVRGGYAGIGALDPDARNIDKFETILTGQIVGQCYALSFANIDHIVSSVNNSAQTMLDGVAIQCGQNSLPGGSALYVTGGGVTILNCTFRNNSAEAFDGGAAYIVGASTQFFHCVFTENTAPFADANGIFAIESNLTLVECQFLGNGCGSTVRNTDNSYAVLLGCLFASNDTGPCAGNSGIVSIDSSAIISDCQFVENDDEGSGAVSNNASIVDVVECVFDSNDGDGSGAIANGSSIVSIRECIFVGNTGGVGLNAGGAIRNSFSDATIRGCTFLSNAAGSQQGWCYSQYQQRCHHYQLGIQRQSCATRCRNCEYPKQSNGRELHIQRQRNCL